MSPAVAVLTCAPWPTLESAKSSVKKLMSLFESNSLTGRGQNADIVFANIAGGASLLVPHNRQQGQPAGKLQLALVASVNSNTRNGKKALPAQTQQFMGFARPGAPR